MLGPFDEDGTPAATAGEDCAAFGGGPGDARNRPRGRLHDGHGVEMAGTLRRAAAARPRRNRRSRRRGQKYGRDRQAPPGRTRPAHSRGLRALEWAAKALGDVDVQYVWRFLRTHKIDLAGRKSWCESNDPDFAAKAAAVVGLYMKPPENALVLAVDEKPSIQALERSQGYLKMPNGRALTGQSHDYTRHGTTTLFAAFDIATGKVT